MWWEKVQRMWNTKDVRNRILFVIGMLVIFRATAHIPIPGVDLASLRNFLNGNQILGLLNIFSGGSITNFSIVMLGVAPYITSSIIFQLLGMVIPSLEELQKEGESGMQKINMYTRLLSVPLAILQGFGLITLLERSHVGITSSLSIFQWFAMLTVVTAGTIFLMWIGELITEKNVGNGISILIFAGIVAGLPGAIQTLLVNYTSSDLYTYILFLVIAVVMIVGIVFISEGQRNIPVSYAKQMHGNRMTGMSQQSHLPLRVNTAGVIPIIFAISVILFPPIIAQFFATGTGTAAQVATFVVELFNNQVFYGVFYFVLVFGFTYFYTAVIFQPDQMAENLQRQGAFIPGIRPGKQTEEYLRKTMSRIVFSGALFLAVIAVLPILVQAFTGMKNLALGGTSLLIVVAVAIEIAKAVEAQMTMHEYDRV